MSSGWSALESNYCLIVVQSIICIENCHSPHFLPSWPLRYLNDSIKTNHHNSHSPPGFITIDWPLSLPGCPPVRSYRSGPRSSPRPSPCSSPRPWVRSSQDPAQAFCLRVRSSGEKVEVEEVLVTPLKDAYSGADFAKKEIQDEYGVVTGEYRVALPDGRIQIVTYRADHEGGFIADVKYEGAAVYPEPGHGYAPARPAPLAHRPPHHAPHHAAPFLGWGLRPSYCYLFS